MLHSCGDEDGSGGTEMLDARVILTTLGSSDDAEQFATKLVERRLAACVNIVGPIRSIYRWQGKVHHDPEYLLLIKTTAERARELEAAFSELHPYDLPERVELGIEAGSAGYLQWLVAQASSEANQ
jgi:periplasmic divalent cation tolerance protein